METEYGKLVNLKPQKYLSVRKKIMLCCKVTNLYQADKSKCINGDYDFRHNNKLI